LTSNKKNGYISQAVVFEDYFNFVKPDLQNYILTTGLGNTDMLKKYAYTSNDNNQISLTDATSICN
jgi:hypothetical protein